MVAGIVIAEAMTTIRDLGERRIELWSLGELADMSNAGGSMVAEVLADLGLNSSRRTAPQHGPHGGQVVKQSVARKCWVPPKMFLRNGYTPIVSRRRPLWRQRSCEPSDDLPGFDPEAE